MTHPSLPDAFSDLQPFVERWCLVGQPSRYDQMRKAAITDLRLFYDAMLPRVDAIVEHLYSFPLDSLPPPEQALFDLALTFAEVAHPIDFKWKTAELDGVFPFERMNFMSASLLW